MRYDIDSFQSLLSSHTGLTTAFWATVESWSFYLLYCVEWIYKTEIWERTCPGKLSQVRSVNPWKSPFWTGKRYGVRSPFCAMFTAASRSECAAREAGDASGCAQRPRRMSGEWNAGLRSGRCNKGGDSGARLRLSEHVKRFESSGGLHAPISNKAMSQRQPKEDRRAAVNKHLPVASKCLAIVLLPKKKQQSKSTGQDVNKDEEGSKYASCAATPGNSTAKSAVPVDSSSAAYTGKEILEDFKQQNRMCYWNPALIESIRKLEYLGFVEPCTVLVGGEDIHLENLRSAWGRRVLKAPNNFTIDRIGKTVNWIKMFRCRSDVVRPSTMN